MKWGIIGAMDTEVELIQKALEEQKVDKGAFVNFVTGKLGNQEVVVCGSGIGTVNAAVHTQLMIERYGVDCVINTGIAGAADDRLKVMDMVVSTEVVYHDRAVDPYTKFPPFRIGFDANNLLVQRATEAIGVLGGKTPFTGRIATGDVFVTDSSLKNSIVDKCKPLCIEMEGAAVAHVAYMNQVPFLVVRTMSDSADDEAGETYDNFFDEAAKRSAEVILQMIKMEDINF